MVKVLGTEDVDLEEYDDDDFDIEIEDDRPEEDRVEPRDPTAVGEEDFDDDPEELEGISEKVKKRINRVRYE